MAGGAGADRGSDEPAGLSGLACFGGRKRARRDRPGAEAGGAGVAPAPRRHSSAFRLPGSFQRRERRWRQQLKARSKGDAVLRRGTMLTGGEAVRLTLELESGPELVATPRSVAESAAPSTLPLGAAAAVSRVGSRSFRLDVGVKGAAQRWTVECPSEHERDGWLLALAAVPGLARRVQDFYEVGRVLGKGGTSEVRECVSRLTGERFALKRCRGPRPSREQLDRLHNELRVLQLCQSDKERHPAIPKLHDFFLTKNGEVALVVELLEGGELFDRIVQRKKLAESDARDVVGQVLDGLVFLHARGIAHRDLKPENVVYASAGADDVRIVDYDLARCFMGDSDAGTPVGTAAYIAPEVVLRERYNQGVDVWAVGAITYVLLCGRQPFGRANVRDDSRERRITAGEFDFPAEHWGCVSREAISFVSSLLVVDPAKRPTAAEALRHPWFIGARRRPSIGADVILESPKAIARDRSGQQLSDFLVESLQQARLTDETGLWDGSVRGGVGSVRGASLFKEFAENGGATPVRFSKAQADRSKLTVDAAAARCAERRWGVDGATNTRDVDVHFLCA